MEKHQNKAKNYQEEDIISYLKNEMDTPEKHQFEYHIQTDAMLHDAIEGLKKNTDLKQVQNIKQDLTLQLQQLTQSSKRKNKKKVDLKLLWMTLIITAALLLFLAVFIIILKTIVK